MSIRSPTVACVVKVTWALVRFGLLAVRLLADFVVTEAMVVFAPFYYSVRGPWGSRAGSPSQFTRWAALAGQPARSRVGGHSQASQAALGRVAGAKGGRALAQRSGLPRLLVCYMPLAVPVNHLASAPALMSFKPDNSQHVPL